MSEAAAKTGSEPAILVAIEQFYPEKERILFDPLVYRFLPVSKRFLVSLLRPGFLRKWMVGAADKAAPGLWGGMLCRKCYIDEKLTDSAETIEQIVNLGAGLDTRLYRLPCIADIPAWELDQPENIEYKRHGIFKALGKPPKNVNLVPIDFDTENLRDKLLAAGYSPNKITFFICEAVAQYLTEAGLRATFSFLSTAKNGSLITFTYIRKKFLDGVDLFNWPAGYKRFVKNKIFISGMEPEDWPGFLAEYNWKIIEDIDYPSMADKYIKPSGRALSADTQVERMIFAVKD